MEMVSIIVNGREERVLEGTTLLEMVEKRGLSPERVVAELNFQIIGKESWSDCRLKAQDSIELVGFVGGG